MSVDGQPATVRDHRVFLLVDTDPLRTLEEVAAFVAGHTAADTARPPREAAYAHLDTVLACCAY